MPFVKAVARVIAFSKAVARDLPFVKEVARVISFSTPFVKAVLYVIAFSKSSPVIAFSKALTGSTCLLSRRPRHRLF